MEDTGHSFLFPLVSPLEVSRNTIERHRAQMAETSRTQEMENKEVVEFVLGPVSAFMEHDSDDEDLIRMTQEVEHEQDWMQDDNDDVLLLMAAAAT